MSTETDGGPAFPGAFKRIVSLVKPTGTNVAERWMSQYHDKERGWNKTNRGDAKTTYEAICDLGPSPDPDAVAAIIGNKSWTHPRCSVTSDELAVGVIFSRDYEEDIILSPDLIFEAVRLLSPAKAVRS